MKIYKRILLAVAGLAIAMPLWAQFAPAPHHQESYDVTLGQLGSRGLEQASLTETITIEGAPWLRLQFSDYNLGRHSYITMTSVEDGGQQRLDAKSLPQWSNASAFFNGESVVLELHVAAGEPGIYVTLGSLNVGERSTDEAATEGDTGTEAQCGSFDNRVASTDNRSGRINGCTAWLVSNGAVLTAGHCVDLDPDRAGDLLPDGVLDLWGSFSVNVPLSDPDRTINQSAPEDQFPIDTSNVTWRFDGEGQGLGKDWAVFGIFPNADGERAHIREGFHRMSRQNPLANDSIRVTGFGVDTGTANRTLQTHAGPYVGETVNGVDIYHKYQVDTEGANSGSPIIWQIAGPDFTIGIHTNAGCDDPIGTSGNHGTSFEVDALEIAVRDFHGAGTEEYVDAVPQPNNPGETGAVFRPYVGVADAVADAVNGSRIIITEGSYTKAAGGNTFTAGADGKAMTFLAPVGTVIIGN